MTLQSGLASERISCSTGANGVRTPRRRPKSIAALIRGERAAHPVGGGCHRAPGQVQRDRRAHHRQGRSRFPRSLDAAAASAQHTADMPPNAGGAGRRARMTSIRNRPRNGSASAVRSAAGRPAPTGAYAPTSGVRGEGAAGAPRARCLRVPPTRCWCRTAWADSSTSITCCSRRAACWCSTRAALPA